jgi:RecF/RecN/SMC N terminal domain
MNVVDEFKGQLYIKSKHLYASWHKVDLHNHSPSSFDYAGNKATAAKDSADYINKAGLSVVMFTDHGCLPTKEFIQEVSRHTDELILRGVELNIFADAFGKPSDKIGREAFFHLLVGFDPDNEYEPDYWLNKLYQECGTENRTVGGNVIKGIKNELDKVIEVLKPANALIIPAHLHSESNTWRSRSLDDIYQDNRFFEFVPNFTALEVTDIKTAEFFDGKHQETKNLEIACIRSSDAHQADQLGIRPTYVLMQKPSFEELKASLGLRSRVSLEEPIKPDCYVSGLHIEGSYLRDMWLALSPHCNVFIGVKGSGKTAVLECLRFVLGVEVPRNSQEQVNKHLMHILGSAGRVKCLVKRQDGSLVLIARGMANQEQFEVSFPDGRVEMFTQVQALGFPAQILGWHEIEHAATDSSVRRKYLDGIAGFEHIAQIESQANLHAEQIKYLHEQAASRYQTFRTLNEQVTSKLEIRRGLQELQDSQLIDLRDKYDTAIAHRDEIKRLTAELPNARKSLADKLKTILPFGQQVLLGSSPLDEPVNQARQKLSSLFSQTENFRVDMELSLSTSETEMQKISMFVDKAFADFSKEYESAVSVLSEDKRRLLDSHRQVMEQTRDLPTLQAQCQQAKDEVQLQLGNLIDLYNEVVKCVDERTEIRRTKLTEFETKLDDPSLKLQLLSTQDSDNLQEYSNKYRDGLTVFQELRTVHASETTLHRRLRKAYEGLLKDLEKGYRLFFTNTEFSHYLTIFENDDLSISFDPVNTGVHKPIDQLSAGQRCTAMFPLLLKLKHGPLVIDQPEDNLDNRHIATKISPVIANDKIHRQIIMTSHNANLLVLSDPENVVVFEGTGAEGDILEQGFLATRKSPVTKHVLDILDGGEKALELRYAKYGKHE